MYMSFSKHKNHTYTYFFTDFTWRRLLFAQVNAARILHTPWSN